MVAGNVDVNAGSRKHATSWQTASYAAGVAANGRLQWWWRRDDAAYAAKGGRVQPQVRMKFDELFSLLNNVFSVYAIPPRWGNFDNFSQKNYFCRQRPSCCGGPTITGCES